MRRNRKCLSAWDGLVGKVIRLSSSITSEIKRNFIGGLKNQTILKFSGFGCFPAQFLCFVRISWETIILTIILDHFHGIGDTLILIRFCVVVDPEHSYLLPWFHIKSRSRVRANKFCLLTGLIESSGNSAIPDSKFSNRNISWIDFLSCHSRYHISLVQLGWVPGGVV